MTELIPTINEIIKYGLQANLTVAGRDKLLEKSLVKIYSLYFDIKFKLDDTEFPDFDKLSLPPIRKNVESNFPGFGLYKTAIDITDIYNKVDDGIGDAIDDLTDIIIDLLEVKWRVENNSLEDGLSFFQLIFYGHTQQHVLDLLNYMKQKNG